MTNKTDNILIQIKELEKQTDELKKSIIVEQKIEKIKRNHDKIKSHIANSKKADDFFHEQKNKPKKMTSTNDDFLLFLGTMGGEYGAVKEFDGHYPRHGGVVIKADGKLIIIDPGKGTKAGLKQLGISLADVTDVLISHAHEFDTTRDLNPIIQNASGLKLFANESIFKESICTESSYDLSRHPPTLSTYELENIKEHNKDITIYKSDKIIGLSWQPSNNEPCSYITPKIAYHSIISSSEELTTGFEIKASKKTIVYVSDSEYDKNLINQYTKKIDVLVINIKTNTLRESKDKFYMNNELKNVSADVKTIIPKKLSFTNRQMGLWGAVKFIDELITKNLLSPESIVVLRAFGVEMIAEQRNNKIFVDREKLADYQEFFELLFEGKCKILIPCRTKINLSDMKIRHIEKPFFSMGAQGIYKFGKDFYYKSDVIKQIVRKLTDRVNNLQFILIEGVTGSGKDQLAKNIANHLDKTYVIINPNSYSDEYFPKLFTGVKDKEFTGVAVRDGYFYNKNLIIIIQEVQSFSQVKLDFFLPLLTDKTYLAANNTIGQYSNVENKIIFTGTDLSDRFGPFIFRMDLHIAMPSLCDRKDDIEALIKGRSIEKNDLQYLSEEALNTLYNFEWKGNTRQLDKVLSTIIESQAFTKDQVIEILDGYKTTVKGKNNIIKLNNGEIIERWEKYEHLFTNLFISSTCVTMQQIIQKFQASDLKVKESSIRQYVSQFVFLKKIIKTGACKNAKYSLPN